MTTLMRPSEVANNLGVHPKSVVRWIRLGVLTADGRRVQLHAKRFGRRYLISPEALASFCDAMHGEPGTNADTAPVAIPTPCLDDELDRALGRKKDVQPIGRKRG